MKKLNKEKFSLFGFTITELSMIFGLLFLIFGVYQKTQSIPKIQTDIEDFSNKITMVESQQINMLSILENYKQIVDLKISTVEERYKEINKKLENIERLLMKF